MGQYLGLDRQFGEFPRSDRCAEMGGISAHDDGGEEVEPSHAVGLALAQQAETGRALQMLHPGGGGAVRKPQSTEKMKAWAC